ncbi:MAG: hypothetical protein KDD59_14535, partial [Bdellovibrionales bacterium]|nr:hypothetical protein [Bdellovibrionales bacterium]
SQFGHTFKTNTAIFRLIIFYHNVFNMIKNKQLWPEIKNIGGKFAGLENRSNVFKTVIQATRYATFSNVGHNLVTRVSVRRGGRVV